MSSADPRFERLKTDPRFRRPARKATKVKVDPRFQALFKESERDGKSKSRATVDKYGRPQSKHKKRDELRRFYRLDEDSDAEPKPDLARGGVLLESSSEDEAGDAAEKDEEQEDDDEPVVLSRPDGTRKPRSPSPEPEIDLDESLATQLTAQASSYSSTNPDAPRTTVSGSETARLAVVNLDWDHVRASDLWKVFASSVPGGQGDGLLSVKVVTSEFGKERLKKEEVEGPPREVFGDAGGEEDEEDVEDEDVIVVDKGEEYDNNALRRYQLERLRYYYAVVTLDSPQTAAHIYSELDGSELERTANVLDLRYIPDSMTFDDADVRDEATEDGGPARGLDFATDALRHSKVKLTWDEDDADRNRLTRRTLSGKDIEEMDFKAYIASSGSDDSDGGEYGPSKRDKLRALLLGGHEEDETMPEGWGGGGKKDIGMEVTFLPGLSEAAAREEEVEDAEEVDLLERYQRKQREKKAVRRAAREEKRVAPAEEEEEEADEADDFFEKETPAAQPTKAKKGKDKKVLVPVKPALAPIATAEELALIVESSSGPGNNSAEAGPSGEKHFDLQQIVRAEKRLAKGKKDKRNRKKRAGEEEDTFELDVRDERFAALHEESEFALDPTHPRFKKTKGMAKLLEERAKRQEAQSDVPRSGRGQTGGEDEELDELLGRVKRRRRESGVNSEDGRQGKKQKR